MIEISIKAFEYPSIQKVKTQLDQFVKRTNVSKMNANLQPQIGFLSFPKRIQRFTVIRSPHIDKKARDQYQLCTHKTVIRIEFPRNRHTGSLLFVFLENLKNTPFSGVQMQIKINSRTFGPFLEKKFV